LGAGLFICAARLRAKLRVSGGLIGSRPGRSPCFNVLARELRKQERAIDVGLLLASLRKPRRS